MIYFGQPEWSDLGDGVPCWHAPHPNEAYGMLDLRPRTASSVRGPTPSGFAIFFYRTPIVDASLRHLGNSPDATLSEQDKSFIASALGIKSLEEGLLHRAIFYELYGVKADPTNTARCKPTLPNSHRVRRLRLPGWGQVIQERFKTDSPSFPAVRDVVQRDYRSVRNEVIAGRLSPNAHRRMLWINERKYHVPWEYLRPSDTPKESPIVAGTSWSEGWNCPNSSDISCDLTWTKVENGTIMDLNNNQVRTIPPSGGTQCSARAEVDVSTDDQQIVLTGTWGNSANTRIVAAATRFSTSAVDYYRLGANDQNDVQAIHKIVGGTPSQLNTNAFDPNAGTHTITANTDGSDLDVTVDAATTLSTTDPDITGNVRGGIAGLGSSASSGFWDDWSITDLHPPTEEEVAIQGLSVMGVVEEQW